MRKLYVVSILILLLSITARAQQPYIVDSNWLAERINDPNIAILHVSREDDYKDGHIPGARFVSWDAYVINDDVRAYDLPELSVLKSLVEKTGLKKGNHVVVYPGKSSHLPVTRLLFTLNYLGFDKVSILSGGKAAWAAQGKELSTDTPDVIATNLKLEPNERFLVSKEEVLDALDTDITIIDCRAEAYYTGIDVNEHHGGRAGHLPGSISISYTSLFEKTDDGHYQFLPEDDLVKIFKKSGLKKNDDIILYCHIGLQLTSVYTVAQQLGYTNVRVYDGSFHEWGPDESLPVTTD